MNNNLDIINIKYPNNSFKNDCKVDRACQFMPFSALSGFKEEIDDANIIKTERKELSEDIQNEINYKLNIIDKNINDLPLVEISYYIDNTLTTIETNIKKINKNKKILVLEDNTNININDITNLNSNIFDTYDLL